MSHNLTRSEKQALIKQWKADAWEIYATLNDLFLTWETTKVTREVVNDSSFLKQHPSYRDLNQITIRALIESVLIGIRRQVDEDHTTHSLHNFILSLKRRAMVYTLQDCIDTHVGLGSAANPGSDDLSEYKERARSLFALVSEHETGCLSGGALKANLGQIRGIAKNPKLIATKYIAHYDRNAPAVQISFEEIDTTLKVLYGVANQYLPLFTVLRSDEFARFNKTQWLTLFDHAWR